MTSDTRNGATYVYNARDRLAELDIGSTVTDDYAYDGLERLAVRTTANMAPSGTTQYVYDQAGHLLAESDVSGNTLTEYVWLDDMPLAMVANVNTSPNLYFVHADHLNRPIMMTDVNKTLVWKADYDPFGATYSIGGLATNNLRFPGQYFLLEDGLHYNWYRYYDPTVGRYTQPDPIREASVTSSAIGDRRADALVPVPQTDGPHNVNFSMLSAFDGGEIGAELPKFGDGPSIYGYAHENPLGFEDRKGLQASAVCVLGGPANPACEAGIAIDVAKICIAAAATIVGMSHRSDSHDDIREHCDQLLRIDTDTCNAITRRRGARAGAVCHQSASERYAACLRGRPLPPLNTWNN